MPSSKAQKLLVKAAIEEAVRLGRAGETNEYTGYTPKSVWEVHPAQKRREAAGFKTKLANPVTHHISYHTDKQGNRRKIWKVSSQGLFDVPVFEKGELSKWMTPKEKEEIKKFKEQRKRENLTERMTRDYREQKTIAPIENFYRMYPEFIDMDSNAIKAGPSGYRDVYEMERVK